MASERAGPLTLRRKAATLADLMRTSAWLPASEFICLLSSCVILRASRLLLGNACCASRHAVYAGSLRSASRAAALSKCQARLGRTPTPL